MVQATEAVKLLLGIGEPLIGRLLTYDALGMRDGDGEPDRPVAGGHAVDADHLPAMLTSGPPELPGLMAASVWMKSKPGAATVSGALAAHDPERHGLLEPERMAERQHELAHAQAVGVAEGKDGTGPADPRP